MKTATRRARRKPAPAKQDTGYLDPATLLKDPDAYSVMEDTLEFQLRELPTHGARDLRAYLVGLLVLVEAMHRLEVEAGVKGDD
jgi:hypothetical protein